MSAAELVAAIMLGALLVYALTGGADFGGGVWDLFAFGPRKAAQRRLIEQAIAPVWEANHVWLIFVVVLLFTGFPRAFAVVSTALHIPLTVMLLGVVLRGSAFVFRQYGPEGQGGTRRWGRVFAVASVVTPVMLGVVLGAITRGAIHVELRWDGDVVTSGFFASWLAPFPFAVGLFALALFAFLAAVYLCVEAEAQGSEPALVEDFRRRALAAAVALGAAALFTGLVAGPGTARFQAALFGAPWSWPLQLVTGLAAIAAIAALVRRRYRLARLFALAQVALIVVGWGLAQRPYLVAPDLTIENAQAPARTLHLLLGAVAGGLVVLLPSLWWLFRTFKRAPARRAGAAIGREEA